MQVIDGVMKQLLSKDLMYEPTKLICEKFPEWLANNKYVALHDQIAFYNIISSAICKLLSYFHSFFNVKKIES